MYFDLPRWLGRLKFGDDVLDDRGDIDLLLTKRLAPKPGKAQQAFDQIAQVPPAIQYV